MPKYLIIAVSLVGFAAIGAAPAWAAWGCGARSSNGIASHNSGEPSEAAARKDALADCKSQGNRRCSIISCSDNVDTIEKARELWPLKGKPTMQCGAAFGTKCPD